MAQPAFDIVVGVLFGKLVCCLDPSFARKLFCEPRPDQRAVHGEVIVTYETLHLTVRGGAKPLHVHPVDLIVRM
jgi:hypothetical protein